MGVLVLVAAIAAIGIASLEQQSSGITVYQFKAGDCLSGSFPPGVNGATWPEYSSLVPCSQPHQAEVVYANPNYWPANASYPGDGAESSQAGNECYGQFEIYDGLTPDQSEYNVYTISPLTASEWNGGSHFLDCVAYLPAPAGVPGVQAATGSIRGSVS